MLYILYVVLFALSDILYFILYTIVYITTIICFYISAVKPTEVACHLFLEAKYAYVSVNVIIMAIFGMSTYMFLLYIKLNK